MLNKTEGMGEVSDESPNIQCPYTIKDFPTVLLGKQNCICADRVASLWLIFFSFSVYYYYYSYYLFFLYFCC